MFLPAQSERESELQLNAAIATLRDHLAEVLNRCVGEEKAARRIANIVDAAADTVRDAVDANATIRLQCHINIRLPRSKRLIEDIEKTGANLNVFAFLEAEIFHQRHVVIVAIRQPCVERRLIRARLPKGRNPDSIDVIQLFADLLVCAADLWIAEQDWSNTADVRCARSCKRIRPEPRLPSVSRVQASARRTGLSARKEDAHGRTALVTGNTGQLPTIQYAAEQLIAASLDDARQVVVIVHDEVMCAVVWLHAVRPIARVERVYRAAVAAEDAQRLRERIRRRVGQIPALP